MTPKMIGKLEQEVITYMGANHPTFPVFMSGQPIPANTTRYCRFWVIPSTELFPVGFGEDAKSRNVGIVQLDVIGPADTGAGETLIVANEFVKMFSRESYSVPEDEGYLVLKDGTSIDSGKVNETHRGISRIGYRYDFKLK